MGILSKIKQIANENVNSDRFTAMFDSAKEYAGNNLKPQIVKQAAGIEYGAIADGLRQLSAVRSIPENVILSLDLLQGAANTYNESTSDRRDDAFLNHLVNNIDAALILSTLEPIAGVIPFGTPVVTVLKWIVKFNSTKKQASGHPKTKKGK
jgi:hypothetical protein